MARPPAHTSITIRRLTPGLKQRLRARAAGNGRSLEAEAREILRCGLSAAPDSEVERFDRIRARFAALGGVQLALPPRLADREPPGFGDGD